MDKKIIEAVMGEAAKSNVEKRQVGCVIVNSKDKIIGTGYNTEGVHAEIAALSSIDKMLLEDIAVGSKDFITQVPLGCKAYISQPPCPECAEALARAGIHDYEVVQPLMKFDGDKVRYDLVPAKTLEDLAKVLTYGARKYKPNNWRNATSEEDLARYEAALLRHIQAWRMGEVNDEESGLPHLAHAICNLAFLHELS